MSEPIVLTESLIKEILSDSLLHRGIVQDFNANLEPGVYTVSDTTQNRPACAYKYGIMVVVGSPTFKQEIFLPILDNGTVSDNRYILFRTLWGDTTRSWRRTLNPFREFT